MDQTFIRRAYLTGFCILLFTLFYYQVLKGQYFFERAQNNYVRVIPSRSIRGTIFDRNQEVLACDKASFNIAVIPYQVKKQKDHLFLELARFLNRSPEALARSYRRRFQNLFSPVDIIVDIDKATALKLKEKFKDAVVINPAPQRYYPYPYEFSHCIGYVKEAASFFDNLKKYGYRPLERVGFLGIEQYYDTYLKGEDGGDLIEINSKGKIVGFLGERQPTRGKDIQLTIDARMQRIGYEVLGGRRGALICMDSNTGEILALVSSPAFDANSFIKGKNLSQFFSSKDKPLINRATQSTYPLGSTFKPIVGLAALTAGTITPSTTFVCKGKLNIGNAVFHCLGSHNDENIYTSLAHSCNIYFYNVARLLSAEKLSTYARSFGLGSLSGIDLPYEKKGIVPVPGKQPRTWYMGDTLNFAIGQGYLESSPIEALVAVNVFASGGYLVRPYMLKKVDTKETAMATKTYLNFSQKNIDIVREGLNEVVNSDEGTARILRDLDLKLAGKTGSAQAKGGAHGWFVGFFPYGQPQYTICVFMENAGSGTEAVKVTHEFLKKLKEEKIL
ncbi:MAG: penicillin-binding protein 2 [Candidatus Omnitrophica bacterium]|nr:penicillin-binding protein 2 [Candidatus Omnitrophota bacterium]